LFFTPLAHATPVIQHWVTGKGVRVYFAETHEIPMVNMRVLFDAGSSRDDQKAGLALLTNALLKEGAAGLSADQISQGFENLGAVYDSGANRDSAAVSLRSLNDPELLEKAIENLKRVISQPDFPDAAFERERNRALTVIKGKQQSPADLASDAFYASVYGDHPYAAPPEGTESSVQSIAVADVRSFHRGYYVARNTIIALVGDLDRPGAERFVDQLTADLPAGKKAPALPEVRALDSAKTVRIDYPSTQTHVLLGQPGIRRTDPDLFPLYVGNHVLGGGGMVSRLFEKIRESRGLSYNTYSYFFPMQQAGPFMAGLETRTDQAEESLKLLHQQLQEYVQNGPTDSELEAAKKNLTGGFPLRIDSNKDIVEYLAMIGFYGLPLDYLDTYNQNIMSVTAARIKQAFRKKLSPDRLVTVLVGQQAAGDLRTAN
jgi:Predicted Zn-dependent peptidases